MLLRSCVVVASASAVVGSFALVGCSAPANTPARSIESYDYRLGVQDAESGTAAAMVANGVDLGAACKEALTSYNMFTKPGEGVGADFYQGCLRRICERYDDGMPNMFNPDYADACRTLGR